MTFGFSTKLRRRLGTIGVAGVPVVGLLAAGSLIAGSFIARSSFAETATPSGGEEAPFVGGLGELPGADRDVLAAILRDAGVKQAKARSVERTPERQVKVMLELASADLERAKAMYCQAGDEVLEQFDPNASREKNHAAMLRALVAILPKAREMGCLNHVRNDDVITVDVSVESVPESLHAAVVKAGEAAVAAKKVERFLAPPREPGSFHFEFKRRDPGVAGADAPAPGGAADSSPAPNQQAAK